MSENEEQQSGFKISDRRKFSMEGEPINSTESTSGPQSSEPQRAARPADAVPNQAEAPEEEETVDFSGFLLSLATSALAYLGEVPDPSTGQKMESLEGAKQMIEIIEMLQRKTEGNLLPEEARLIDNLLYELRMKYLAKRKVIHL